MESLSTIAPRRRGRPLAQQQSNVVDDLIAATESALAIKTAKEVTVREISTAAGTSEAMIRYYFGGKEGLLLAVLKDFMSRSPHLKSDEIISLCLSAGSIKPAVTELCKFHYARPSLIKMITVELLSSSSEFKDTYLKRYGRCMDVLSQNVVNALKDAQVYRPDIHTRFVAMSLLRLIVAPILESAVIGTAQRPLEIESGEWPDFVASTIDSMSR